MKKLLINILCILIAGCVSADPNQTEVKITKSEIRWDEDHQFVFDDHNFNITLELNRNKTSELKEIFSNYEVDGYKSGFKYLQKNYHIGLIKIKNKSGRKNVFHLNNLHLATQKGEITPISPFNLPTDIKRVNPKGITKNVYNTAVIVAVASAVIAACVIIAKENNGKIPMEIITAIPAPNSEDISSVTNKDYFSKIFHTTTFTYDDMINPENEIDPKSEKVGLIFIPKKGALDKKTFLTYTL